MTVFRYKAFQADGNAVIGELSAPSQEVAEAKLHEQKLSPVYVVQGGKAPVERSLKNKAEAYKPKRFRRNRVTNEDICDLLRSMAVMCKAGVSLVDSLDTIIVNASNEAMEDIGKRVKADVLAGKSLSRGLEAFPQYFPDIVCEMVGVADEGGQLAQALTNATNYLEERNQVKKTVGAALVYPLMLLGICGLTTLGFMVFILPTFAQTFAGMNVKLPAITQMLLNLGTFLQKNLTLLVITLITLPLAARKILRIPRVKDAISNLTYKLPIAGPVVQLMALARASSTLASLMGTNIPIMLSLEYAGKVAYYRTLVQAFDKVRSDVESGSTLAEAMGATHAFPPMTVQLVSVGERSGQLPELLQTASEQLQAQADRRLKAMLALMEPTLIVFMGGLIGTLTLSILMPLFQLNSNIK